MPIKINGHGEVSPDVLGHHQIEEVRVKGIGTVWKGVEIVDDFESGSEAGWGFVNPAERDDADIVRPGLRGSGFAWRHTDFVNVHLTGGNAVDRGPQPGDIFEFWFYIADITGSPVINRFEFSSESVNDDQCYRIEFEANTDAPEFQLEDVASGEIDTDPGVEFEQDSLYSIHVEWKHNDNNVRARAFNEPGHTPVSQWIELYEPAPGAEYDNPGISLFSDANNTIVWDEIRILDSA